MRQPDAVLTTRSVTPLRRARLTRLLDDLHLVKSRANRCLSSADTEAGGYMVTMLAQAISGVVRGSSATALLRIRRKQRYCVIRLGTAAAWRV